MRIATPEISQPALIPRVFVDGPKAQVAHLWLHAPAGYGKSVAAQQILALRGSTPVALRLETAHGDVSYLIQSLVSAYSNQTDPAPFNSPPRSLSEVIDHIVRNSLKESLNDSSVGIGKKVCFFFENFETISAAVDARDSLARAILDRLDDLELIVTSQVPLTGIWQRLASCQSFGKLTADDLAFSEFETEQLIKSRLHLNDDQSERLTKALFAQAHGWPSETSYALEHLVRSGHHDGLLQFDPDQSLLSSNDLFTDELIAQAAPSLQKTLEIMSLLPPLSVEQVVAWFGIDIARKLDAFRQKTSLLHFETSVARSGQSLLTLHPRLRTALSQRPALYGPERREEIGDLAEALFAASQEDLALDLLCSAGHHEAIASYLSANGQLLLQAGRLVLLGRLLAKLPDAMLEQLPALKFFRGILKLQANPFEAISDFEASLWFAKQINEPNLIVFSWAFLIDAIWFAWTDGTALDPLIEELPFIQSQVEISQNPVLKSVLSRGAFTALSLRQPDHPDFEHWEQQSLLDLQKQAPRHEVARRGTQILIHLIYGPADKHNADLVLRRVRQFHDGKNETAADHCSYYVVKSSFDAWFSSDHASGPTIAYTGLNVSGDLGVPYWDALLINAALYRLSASEDRVSMDTFIELLEERIGPTSRSQDSAILHHFLAYRDWLDGNYSRAEKAISLALSIVNDSGFVLAPLFFKPGSAVIQHKLGNTAQALKLIEQTIEQAERQRTLLASFIAKMVKSTIFLEHGSQEQQEIAIRDAFTLGAQTELMAVPWLTVSQQSQLCEIAISLNCEPGYARKLSAAVQPHKSNQDDEKLKIRTLGVPDILKDEKSILTSRKPQKISLLAISFLVVSGKSGITSERLIELLWPETEPETGRQRLKTLLYRLRGMLGDKDAISVSNGTISLNPDLISVDTWELLTASEKREVEFQKEAIKLYNGIFFDGFLSHPDLLLYRAQIENVVEGLVLKIGADQSNGGDWSGALAVYEEGLYRLGANMELLKNATKCLAQLNLPTKKAAFVEKWTPAFRDTFDIDLTSYHF